MSVIFAKWLFFTCFANASSIFSSTMCVMLDESIPIVILRVSISLIKSFPWISESVLKKIGWMFCWVHGRRHCGQVGELKVFINYQSFWLPRLNTLTCSSRSLSNWNERYVHKGCSNCCRPPPKYYGKLYILVACSHFKVSHRTNYKIVTPFKYW